MQGFGPQCDMGSTSLKQALALERPPLRYAIDGSAPQRSLLRDGLGSKNSRYKAPTCRLRLELHLEGYEYDKRLARSKKCVSTEWPYQPDHRSAAGNLPHFTISKGPRRTISIRASSASLLSPRISLETSDLRKNHHIRQ